MRLGLPLLGLLLLLLGCDSRPRTELLPPEVAPPPVEPGPDVDDDADEAWSRYSCWPSELCSCADGRRGEIECRAQDAYCNCDICPAFEPKEAKPFEPCGGELVGAWRATTSDFSAMNLVIYSGAHVIESCPVHVASHSGAYDLRFAFGTAGEAAVSVRGPTLAFNFEDSCAPGSCDQLGALGSGTLECGEGACGICTCEMVGPSVARDGSWTRDEHTLRIEDDASLLYEAEFCVTPEQLLVRDPSGVTIVMKKAIGTGAPRPCDQRTTMECTQSSGCALHVGVCSGTVPDECELEDYDVVPGCEFVTEPYP